MKKKSFLALTVLIAALFLLAGCASGAKAAAAAQAKPTAAQAQPTVAQAKPTPGLAFTPINNNTAYEVAKGTATAAAVVIPAAYEGKPVTQIAGNGFRGYTAMTSVTIPGSVTSIGGGAFYGCSGLTGVTIPNSVTSIGGSAFYGCSGLTGVTIPNSVASIGNNAFFGCTGLTTVTIPSSVTSIDVFTFAACTGLTTVTIPASVTSIGSWAFSGSGLTTVTFQGTIAPANFSSNNTFDGDLRDKYLAGGIGTYRRPSGSSNTWTKQ